VTAAVATIRIEAATRWDAIDLARRLASHHTYLVQLGDRRWHVCVRPDAAGDELPVVRAAAERWAHERRLETTLHCGDETVELHG
jgi:uncharacterized protein (DUF2252 family)